MKHPIGGINYDPINKPQNSISQGAASFTFSPFRLRAPDLRAKGAGRKRLIENYGYFRLFRQKQRRAERPGDVLHRRI